MTKIDDVEEKCKPSEFSILIYLVFHGQVLSEKHFPGHNMRFLYLVLKTTIPTSLHANFINNYKTFLKKVNYELYYFVQKMGGNFSCSKTQRSEVTMKRKCSASVGPWPTVFTVEHEHSTVMVTSEEPMAEADPKLCLTYLIGDFVLGLLSRVRIAPFLKLKNWYCIHINDNEKNKRINTCI